MKAHNVMDNKLFEAVKENNLEEASSILMAGANIGVRDRLGRTPLHYASDHGHTATVELLLSKGANIDTKSLYGGTPLHYASMNGRTAIVVLLLDRGADKYALFDFGQNSIELVAEYNHKRPLEILLEENPAVSSSEGVGKSRKSGYSRS